jgi:phenylalanyl-tRNA synthetase beta chain
VVGYEGHTPKTVSFPLSEVKRLTGLDVPRAEIAWSILDTGSVRASRHPGGDEKAQGQGRGRGRVTVPSWRPDIEGKADLVEEVMRIHGVDEIAPQPLTAHDTVNGRVLTTLQNRTRAARGRWPCAA